MAFCLAKSEQICRLCPRPLQHFIDRRYRDWVIGWAGAAVDCQGAFPALGRLREFFIERLDEFAAADGEQELFETDVGRLVAIADGHQEPLKGDFGIAGAREVKGAIQLGH